MDIYLRKKRWKWILFGAALIIVAISLYYTNILVKEIRKDERKNVKVWADAIHRKADLVNFTNKLFEQISDEERQSVATLAEAQRLTVEARPDQDVTFYVRIIENNTSIPVIETDKDGNIISARNVPFNLDTLKKLTGQLQKEFSVYPPIVNNYIAGKQLRLYYKDSNIFTELRVVLNDLIKSFFSEVVLNSASVPVIITDSTQRNVIEFGQIPPKKMKNPEFVSKMLRSMEAENQPIRVDLADTGARYIFYKNSFLLTQLKFYPYIMFAVIGVFLFIAYLLFSYARKSEQNQVWVGMAKETAHQLGTPLSSMMAWVELLQLKGIDEETLNEIRKDVRRLEVITDRFSKIGSAARVEPVNVVQVVNDAVSYLRSRTSSHVVFEVNPIPPAEIIVPLNTHLFEWVIENLIKNAVDAMEGKGIVKIEIKDDPSVVTIDVSDTGKGIPKSRFKTIFNPGFTSKQRGWGLGLTLSRRIIDNYHKGRIFVKSSVLNKGTTFRIQLHK
ncbi:MAG: HAMP domain-containing sensor histidine kinase [Bacteroidota bacterium]|nr:HAMP domain-containing sensor histidine kinase [Bacteroidota bacterium]